MKNLLIRFVLASGMIVMGLGITQAQDMPRQVVGNAGDYYQSVLFGNLHWTVGEIAVSRHENGLQLAEGFHQVYFDLLVEAEELPPDWEVKVYPNPTTDWVRLDFPVEQQVDAALYHASGQLLYQTTQLQAGSSLDMSTYPEGTYLLRLSDEQQNIHTVRILKMRR